MSEGRCLCGNVRFAAAPPYQWVSHCHCSMCRKHYGTLFGTLVAVNRNGFRWLAGQEHIVHYRSSPAFARPFCGTCGSSLPAEEGEMVVCPAALLSDLVPKPSAHVHILVGSKSPMHDITDALPQFPEYPPGYGATVAGPNVTVPDDGKVHGSCLCGTVAFTLAAAPTRMINCHCSRCRLSRAGTHGTNVFAPIDSLQWVRGVEHVKTYRLPEAAMFATSFCDRCGSLLPARFEKINRYLVPVGSLDSALPVKPGVHIYVDDKLPWVEITDSLPQFAQMPPRERLADIFFGT